MEKIHYYNIITRLASNNPGIVTMLVKSADSYMDSLWGYRKTCMHDDFDVRTKAVGEVIYNKGIFCGILHSLTCFNQITREEELAIFSEITEAESHMRDLQQTEEPSKETESEDMKNDEDDEGSIK